MLDPGFGEIMAWLVEKIVRAAQSRDHPLKGYRGAPIIERLLRHGLGFLTRLGHIGEFDQLSSQLKASLFSIAGPHLGWSERR